MPKNETGEFELVLGNRQLLSGFAIVAILFGIFFALGYVIGRNSAPSARAAAADTQAPGVSQPESTRAPVATPPAASSAPPTDTSAAAPSQPATQRPAEATPQPTTQPARDTPAPPPQQKPAETDAVKVVADPQPGTYLQVISINRRDAEVIAKALVGKGFSTLITPSPLEGNFRVIVGPYKDSSSLGTAKGELEKSGFHPIPLKIAEKG
jgi:cell division protein FtsN